MTDMEKREEGEMSLLALVAVLLRNRWRIIGMMIAGALVALLAVWSRPALYMATTSFIPEGSDPGRSALAGLAGQLGVAVPQSGLSSSSPEFYTTLLKSRVLLTPILYDTVTVTEMNGRRMAVIDIFKVEKGPQKVREEEGVAALSGVIKPTIIRSTGAIQVAVLTRWPSVSLAIASAMVDGVTDFNKRTRHTQAANERSFVQERLGVASTELRDAEERLQAFLTNNRELGGSPSLQFERDRLQRNLDLRQRVFTTLTQAFEDARIREIRDAPGITLFEPPAVPSLPEPRGRGRVMVVGLLFGAVLGSLLAFLLELMQRRHRGGAGEADEFFSALDDVKREVLTPVRWVGGQRSRRRS